ncbi:MAG: hypothetical protein ACI82H_001553, partial [Alphaproteobacteria bacterium]
MSALPLVRRGILARAGDVAGRGLWQRFSAALAEMRRDFHARITGVLGGEGGAVASALMTNSPRRDGCHARIGARPSV